jgi:hypothetical protein
VAYWIVILSIIILGLAAAAQKLQSAAQKRPRFAALGAFCGGLQWHKNTSAVRGVFLTV